MNESSVCVCKSIGKFVCRHNEMFRQYSFLFCGRVTAPCCVALDWFGMAYSFAYFPCSCVRVIVQKWCRLPNLRALSSLSLISRILILMRVFHSLYFRHIIFCYLILYFSLFVLILAVYSFIAIALLGCW